MRMQSALGGFFFLFLGATAAWAQQQPTVKATTLLKTTTTIIGQKLEYPGKNPQVTATVVEIPPGVDVGWHEHPNIRYVYVIEGTLTIGWRTEPGGNSRPERSSSRRSEPGITA